MTKGYEELLKSDESKLREKWYRDRYLECIEEKATYRKCGIACWLRENVDI